MNRLESFGIQDNVKDCNLPEFDDIIKNLDKQTWITMTIVMPVTKINGMETKKLEDTSGQPHNLVENWI